MLAAQKPQFLALLTAALASYAKPLPEAGIVAAWWANLEPYSLQQVAAAFRAYCDENGEFAPVPAGIAMRCKLMDGRPGPEEAWAIALASQDERDTVVWTAETASAFSACQSVLAMGDEVGARMAFREAYVRFVAQARAALQPAQWSVSLGWDTGKRTAALTKAATAGLLAAPAVALLLAGPEGDAPPDAKAREQIAKIKQMQADAAAIKEAEHLAAIEQERLDTEAYKARTRQQVADYLKGEG